jgi:hypothetical protein
VDVPPGQALEVAQVKALQQLLRGKAISPEQRRDYVWAQAGVSAQLQPAALDKDLFLQPAGRYAKGGTSSTGIDVAVRGDALWLTLPKRPPVQLRPLTKIHSQSMATRACGSDCKRTLWNCFGVMRTRHAFTGASERQTRGLHGGTHGLSNRRPGNDPSSANCGRVFIAPCTRAKHSETKRSGASQQNHSRAGPMRSALRVGGWWRLQPINQTLARNHGASKRKHLGREASKYAISRADADRAIVQTRIAIDA